MVLVQVPTLRLKLTRVRSFGVLVPREVEAAASSAERCHALRCQCGYV